VTVLVLGLGNLVHCDDGAGVRAIEALQTDPRVPRDVELLDGGTQGLALLPHISGVGRLMVLDAIDAALPTGTLMRFEGDAFQGLPGKPIVHQLGFADLMVALRLLGKYPGEIVVLGVQPGSTDWGTELTPRVRLAIPGLIGCAITQLQTWYAEPPGGVSGYLAGT
jgi:hydrogenase maturation protease